MSSEEVTTDPKNKDWQKITQTKLSTPNQSTGAELGNLTQVNTDLKKFRHLRHRKIAEDDYRVTERVQRRHPKYLNY